MKELVELLEFVQRRQEMAGAITKIAAVLTDGIFGPQRRPALAGYNAAFEEEAQRLMVQLFRVTRTAQHCFELAELFKFGSNPYFPGTDVEIDYARAAYWFSAAADLGHRETTLFFHRMVPQYFMKNTTPEDTQIAVMEALVAQEVLAKANQGETVEERKRREAVNDFVIDAFLYPEEHEIDEFWFDTIGKNIGYAPDEYTVRKNNVRPLFER